MKKIILVGIAFSVVMRLECSAQQLRSIDFEGGNNAGLVETSPSTNLSLTLTVLTDGQNHYGHYVAVNDISGQGPNARWYAGAGALIGGLLNPFTIPPAWQIDFDINRGLVEPIRVQLEGDHLGYTGWVTPSSTGWAHVSVTSDQFSPDAGDGFLLGHVCINIEMASNDALGNPLTLRDPGTYTMDIDNIAITQIPAAPEPCIGFIAIGAICLAAKRGDYGCQKRNKCITQS